MRYPDGRFFEDNDVLGDLSRPLQLELREHSCDKVLRLLGITRGSRTSHLLADVLEYIPSSPPRADVSSPHHPVLTCPLLTTPC